MKKILGGFREGDKDPSVVEYPGDRTSGLVIERSRV